jgi:hypothetical protein
VTFHLGPVNASALSVLHLTRPPRRNGYDESFAGWLRNECLNIHLD